MSLNKLSIYKISPFLITLTLMLFISNTKAIYICPLIDSTKSNSLWISKNKDYIFNNSNFKIYKISNDVVAFFDKTLYIDDYLYYYDIVNKDSCHSSRFIDKVRSVYCIKDSVLCKDFFNTHQFKEMHLANEVAISYYFYYKEYGCENEQVLSFLERPCRYIWDIVFTHNEKPIDTVEVFTSEKKIDSIETFPGSIEVLESNIKDNLKVYKYKNVCVILGEILIYFKISDEFYTSYGIEYPFINTFICE